MWFAISACFLVSRALSARRDFDFGRDVLLLEEEKNVIDVGKPTEELVKNMVENRLAVFRSERLKLRP